MSEQIESVITATSGDSITRIKQLRLFEGSPNDFWPTLLDEMAQLFAAQTAFLLIQRKENAWSMLASRQPTSSSPGNELIQQAEKLAELSLSPGFSCRKHDNQWLFAGSFDTREGQPHSVIVLLLPTTPDLSLEDTGREFRLLADIPLSYQLNRMVDRTQGSAVFAIDALDLMAQLNDTDRFIHAAMSVCNEIANRHKCDRVSLGWLEDGYIRLKAISHMEKFDPKMAVVQLLEKLMEEALDQDAEILWPRPEDEITVVRDHRAFSWQEESDNILSLPLRIEREPVAVITCERAKPAFPPEEIRGLRILADQVVRRLEDLRLANRWFWPRWKDAFRKRLDKLFGFEHSVAKFASLVGFILLLVLIFARWDYRVEASFILRTNDLAFIPAPFDGYIDQAKVKIGDQVLRDELILQLDTDELLMREAEGVADHSRYAREEDKARAANILADMRISAALKEQARARLDEIRYQLKHAHIKAPFDGIVVEGDLQKMQGAPVKKGDILFKIALLDKLYVELDLDETNIHEVGPQSTGEIAFVSRPGMKFPIRITRIHPAATVKKESNVFTLEAEFTDGLKKWWRPGMSGVAKIDVGERRIIWVLTHKTMDFFRLLLWM